MARDKKPETSASGNPIHRYEARDRDWTAPAESKGMEAIEEHCTRFFGEAETVFHEIVSDLVHIDVHVVPPRPTRNVWTLYTTGMSDLAMTVPEGAEDARFAELLLFLPAGWRVDQLDVTPPPPDLERWYWPVRWLKMLARFPHEYETWLGSGHSMPNGDPPEPFAPDTSLCAWMLLPPISVPAEGRTITLPDRTVNLYVLHALHPDELELKLARGMNDLLDAFEQHDVSDVLQIDRPSSVG